MKSRQMLDKNVVKIHKKICKYSRKFIDKLNNDMYNIKVNMYEGLMGWIALFYNGVENGCLQPFLPEIA